MPDRRDRADVLLALLAAAVVCAPLWNGSFAARDSAFTAIAMQAVAEDPSGGTCELGFPAPFPLTQSDWVLAQGLLARPLLLLGAPLYRAHDAVVALGLVTTTLAATLLSRRLTGPGLHNAAAGVLAGLAPIVTAHGQHANLVHHGLAITAVLLWLDANDRDSVPRAIAAGALAGLGLQLGVYLGAHAILILGGFLAVGSRRTVAAAVGGLVLGLLPAIPVAWMYLGVARDNAITVPAQELRDTSWHLADTLRPLRSPLHGPLAAIWPVPEPKSGLGWMNPANPGYLATAAALLAPDVRHRRVLLGIGAVALALALGPEIIVFDPGGTGVPGPAALLARLPGVAALREPARWWMVAVIALSPLTAAGVARVARGRWWVAVLAVAVMILETPPLRTSPLAAVTPEPVYARLSDLPAGPLYDEALRHESSCGGKAGTAILAAGDHRRPLVGAHYARRTPLLDDVNRRAGTWPSADALELFQEIGVHATLEHPPLRGAVPAGATCRIIEDHRLCSIP